MFQREEFEIAAGSVPGRSHVLAGRPNQDAYAFAAGERGLVALVADGCGSTEHSEVGASMGVRVIASALLERIDAGASVADPATWADVRSRALSALEAAARAMGGPLARTVADYFLFTVLGIAIDEARAVVFGIGDGFFVIGGERVRIGPFPNNAPPYLAYGLLGDGPHFTVHRALAVNTLDRALVGTDGAADLDALAGADVPGAPGERVGPIEQFLTEDRYFRNRDAIRRRLALLNREVSRPLWGERRMHRDPGLLDDDTTVLSLRRRITRAA